MMANSAWRLPAGLGSSSRVLLISTEGATAPNVYARIVGNTAENVLVAQNRWLEAHGMPGPGPSCLSV
jgi:diaminopropionate ammonia-lyase